MPIDSISPGLRATVQILICMTYKTQRAATRRIVRDGANRFLIRCHLPMRPPTESLRGAAEGGAQAPSLAGLTVTLMM